MDTFFHRQVRRRIRSTLQLLCWQSDNVADLPATTATADVVRCRYGFNVCSRMERVRERGILVAERHRVVLGGAGSGVAGGASGPRRVELRLMAVGLPCDDDQVAAPVAVQQWIAVLGPAAGFSSYCFRGLRITTMHSNAVFSRTCNLQSNGKMEKKLCWNQGFVSGSGSGF